MLRSKKKLTLSRVVREESKVCKFAVWTLSEMTTESCVVCLGDDVVVAINCPQCRATVHPACEQDNLLNSVLDPRCPACSREWSYDFLTTHLPKSWLLRIYKKYREGILLDREKALLPHSQDAAAQVLRRRKSKELLVANRQLVLDARREEYSTRHRIEALRKSGDIAGANKLKEQNKSQKEVLATLRRNHSLIANGNFDVETGAVIRGDSIPAVEENVSIRRREFVHPCPSLECRGFLSTTWRCKMCGLYACSKCGDLIGSNEDVANHTCNPDTQASFTQVRRDSRPCPKCAAPISKVSGCDHMFCVICKTAFSWRTGEIHPTGNSNPYYWQWRSAQTIPRAVAETCDPVTRAEAILEQARLQYVSLNEIQGIQHIQYYLLPRFAIDFHGEDFHNLRVKYLLKDISEDEWRVGIQRVEKKHRKARFIFNVLDLFVNASLDILAQASSPEQVKEVPKQIEEIRILCNKEFSRIPVIFNSTEYYLNKSYDLRRRPPPRYSEDE